MITEDYCSYEVAKLLKEKGFDEPLRCWYDNFQDFHEEGVRMSNTDCLPPTIMCPTHQMAMKWLREVHNIAIETILLSCGWFCQIEKILDGFCKECTDETVYSYKTYEEAVEAAIKYSLENLI